MEFLLARHFFCRYACAVGLFQSLAWMANDRAMVVGFDTRRASACATCPSVCDEACPMRLKPRTIKRRMFTCTECGECIAACTRVQGGDPKQSLLRWVEGDAALPVVTGRPAPDRTPNPAPESGRAGPADGGSDPMEEQVGALWHRVITRFADRRYPQAAARLQDLAPTLGILFRALGGDGGLQVEAADPKAHGARRGFLQWLAGTGDKADLAWRDDRSLRLPESIDCFPDPGLNRDLYLWLTALAVHQPGRQGRAATRPTRSRPGCWPTSGSPGGPWTTSRASGPAISAWWPGTWPCAPSPHACPRRRRPASG